MRLSFVIPGEPKGKGRPRAHARIVYDDDGEPRAVVSMHTPADTVAAERDILRIFRAKYPHHPKYTGAVLINFTAIFETPPSWTKALKAAAATGTLYSTKKPDKDNIEKLLVDALNGFAWHDDAQVMGGGVKRYGSPARTEVVIQALESPDMPPTPGEKRLQARDAAGTDATPEKRVRRNPAKSGSGGQPTALAKAIAAALARDKAAKG